ncbi:armadillo repeat-containing protein 8-like isoform X4 [Branchiostoma lanceolatum]|uniref:armadillo repeat-containing protein 8-like isoform X4 n=1 Tax=Branchiostoma lanceolatum TaxID=7740 RepID=UPI003452D3E5
MMLMDTSDMICDTYPGDMVGREYMENLYGEDMDRVLHSVVKLKNAVIGNNKQKFHMMSLGVVARLLEFIQNERAAVGLRTESAIVLGSLAKGSQANVKRLVDSGVVPILLQCLNNSNLKFVEGCLRCLRSIFTSQAAPVDLLYTDPGVVPHMLDIVSQSPTTQECICSILAQCCKTSEHQGLLYSNGVIESLAPLLASKMYKVCSHRLWVQMPALRVFCVITYMNQIVSSAVASASVSERSLPDLLVELCLRDKSVEMQMSSAKCLTYMCRANALSSQDSKIVYKALPTLIRMCKKDRSLEERVEGAETLAYLIEVDLELQRIASYSDHLIPTLSEFLRYPSTQTTVMDLKRLDYDMKHSHELKAAALMAFASLGANDEDIRKKIIETENLMDHVVCGLSDPVVRVRLAAVRCLHSLSRSVQQLRTSFQDHAVWKPLMKLLQNADDDMLTVASSTLCNLLLEFSPSKEPMLESGAVDLLCDLTKRDDPALRLNGIWALMNMAFQAEQKVKSQILAALGTDQLFKLLSDPDVNVLMKTLGLLRNLLSNKPSFFPQHIDHIMGMHGQQIMQAIVLILEGEHTIEVKEQTLCILANISDGTTAKDFIMANDDVLKKITNYMIHANVRLQIAATFCISNLVWNEEEGALERQMKLRDMGVQKLLQQLLSSSDTVLFDKVKTALQQFT